MRSPPNPRAAWPSSDDNTGFNLIVILLGCCVGAYLLWTCYHREISACVIALRHHEIGFIQLFTGRYDLADRQMLAADPEGVTLRDLYGISHAVGMFFRIPAAVFMLLLAAICAARAAPARYKRAFDLDGLIREQALSFRTSAAFVRRRLRSCLGLEPVLGPARGRTRGRRQAQRRASRGPSITHWRPRRGSPASRPAWTETLTRWLRGAPWYASWVSAGGACEMPARRSAACLPPLRCTWRRDEPTRCACSGIFRAVWPTRIRTSQRALTLHSLCLRRSAPRLMPSSATESW
jgi:hypothetical protein